MKSLAVLIAAAGVLSGCAGLSPQEIAKLPVVNYGQPAPATGEYVLRYPAGVDLPVVATVGGTLMAQPVQAKINARVKQDVYIYKDQVSFDGKQWSPASSKIGGQFTISPPGFKGATLDPQAAGEMNAIFDLK